MFSIHPWKVYMTEKNVTFPRNIALYLKYVVLAFKKKKSATYRETDLLTYGQRVS